MEFIPRDSIASFPGSLLPFENESLGMRLETAGLQQTSRITHQAFLYNHCAKVLPSCLHYINTLAIRAYFYKWRWLY